MMQRYYSVELRVSETSSGHMGSRGVIADSYWAVVIEPYGIEKTHFKSKEEAEAYKTKLEAETVK